MTGVTRWLILALAAAGLAGCAGTAGKDKAAAPAQQTPFESPRDRIDAQGTIWDLFTNADDPNVTIAVNKYIWKAALDVLSFMPVEAADPFSGVITMGWGRPPGSTRSYRATVYITDPALDARSLKLALLTRSGPASKDTVRALEDAILTRARQLRIADSKL